MYCDEEFNFKQFGSKYNKYTVNESILSGQCVNMVFTCILAIILRRDGNVCREGAETGRGLT